MALEMCSVLSTDATYCLKSTVANGLSSSDNQYDYPSATKGGAREVEMRDFAAANQMCLGEFRAWLSLFPLGDPTVAQDRSTDTKLRPRLEEHKLTAGDCELFQLAFTVKPY